ncbi:MAG: flavodoxin-dependent (E)-4-hydroxy-3-methylbut-2-enyl-diphosphate synthase, partial [Bacteroidales bacterium]|nr:flavodoxin-dependent (E)-4-hydroxy-3-methylbut-2-enyl-diphosphate synthase [Bacteroidales bacterium]
MGIFAREVKVGDVVIGGGNRIAIQSMTNVPVGDISGSVLQCKQLFDAGADLVRLSVPRLPDVDCLRQVKKILVADGYKKPLVADVHFNPNVADLAAAVADKVRINPGNYVDPARTFKTVDYTDEEYAEELLRLENRFKTLLNICKIHGTALRIGVNHGSLSDRIMSRY